MKRYTVKRGRRAACQYDVLVYDGNKPDGDALVFAGSFVRAGNRRLKGDELKITATIKQALEAME